MGPRAHRPVLAPHAAMGVVDVAGPFAGHDLVRLSRLAIEVEHELECGRQTPVPVAGKSGPLVPDVKAEAPPALSSHPVEPGFPIGLPLVVAVDEAEVDEHLAILGYHLVEVVEDAAHQGVPIADPTGGVVPLVAVGWAREQQRRALAVHDP